MARTRALVFAMCVAGCGGTSNNNTGDDGVEVDAGVGETCTSSTECGPDLPICTATGTCVQCETSADCTGDLPVCSNQTCTAACAGDEVTANFVTIPSDIIWVVDQSGSMTQETANVQAKINDFVALIASSNIDYRVVMLATPTGTNAICVPGPLGGTACGNNTQFRLVDQRIGSTNGPSLAISRYASYSDFLRPEAVKHFVFVTDDNSAMSAASFTAAVAALQPAGMFDNYRVHGIYAFGNGTSTGCTGPFGTGAKDGTVYTTLIGQTMGAAGVICNDDWSQVFTDITAAVVSGSQVACELEIPAPPMGQTLDPAKVNVKYQTGGSAGQTLTQVQTAGDCAGAGGWYYDDNTAPTRILLCPSTCGTVQSDPTANVKVEFGCSTQIF